MVFNISIWIRPCGILIKVFNQLQSRQPVLTQDPNFFIVMIIVQLYVIPFPLWSINCSFLYLDSPRSRQRTLWFCGFWPRPRPALTTLRPMILSTTSTSGSQVLFAVSEFWRRNMFFLLMLISLRVLCCRHDIYNYYHVILKFNISISLESLHESSPWYCCWNGILVDGHVYGLGPQNLIKIPAQL